MYGYNMAARNPGYLLASLFPLLLLLLIPHIIIGCLCKKLSYQKGYSGHFWTGFFLGILGLLYVIGLPDIALRECIKASCEKLDGKNQYTNNAESNQHANPSENAQY